jgi:hypothetical protein
MQTLGTRQPKSFFRGINVPFYPAISMPPQRATRCDTLSFALTLGGEAVTDRCD